MNKYLLQSYFLGIFNSLIWEPQTTEKCANEIKISQQEVSAKVYQEVILTYVNLTCTYGTGATNHVFQEEAQKNPGRQKYLH